MKSVDDAASIGKFPAAVAVNMAAVLIDVNKTFRRGRDEVNALRNVSLQIHSRSFVAITGPSGAGKTTLLQVLGGIERPDSGKVCVGGKDIGELSEAERTVFRRRNLGFVFQFFNLLPTLTAWENVAVPLTLDGARRSVARTRAKEMLDLMGLAKRAEHHPRELSGGEMQRTAIARALISEPALILADEPTGNLDSETGRSVLRLLRQVVDDRGGTVVMVTHSLEAADVADRSIRFVDGVPLPA